MKRIITLFLFFTSLTASSLQATVVDALSNLAARAEQSKTDSLLVLRQGRPVLEYHTCKEFARYDCREITRPILALAFGFLFDERYITSLDTPVSTFCPNWDNGISTNISIRTLLAAEDDTFYRLGEVVKAISGETWHDYIQIKLLTPLGISKDCWHVNECGQVRLHLSAPELAKIGSLIACKGQNHSKQLLSRQWISCLQTPTDHVSPFLAMQWYLEYLDFSTYWSKELIDLYACKGVSACVTHNLEALNGRVIHFGGLAIRGKLIHAWGRDIFCALGGQNGLTTLIADTYKHHLPLGYFNGGGIKSIVAWGTGGQQLIIIPQRNIIAVRQTAHPCDSFEDLVEALDAYSTQTDCYID